jgi:two-component system NtrC family sensor kinase
MERWEERVRQLRDSKLSRVPVVALSSDASLKAAKPTEVDAYLQKPVNPQLLLDTVSRLLGALQKERLLARSLETERLSSLGVLSAGIAHEINNPLSFVAGNLELARSQCADLSLRSDPQLAAALKDLDRLLHHALRGAERVSEVVRGVTMFARPDRGEVGAIDVHEVLEATVQLMSNEIRHRARLERSYEALPPVMGNPVKLQQALLNLMIHAVQAMAEGAPAEHVIRLVTELRAGREVVIAVELRAPTSAARPPRAGVSGPALSLSERIVGDLGGHLDVESSPEGLMFRVVLPAGREETREADEAVPEVRAASGKARLLVIDDEQLMCDLLSAMLGDDYEVVALNNSREALTRLQQGESFDLLLCDLMMPELTGMELYAELARSRPEQAARMVFMTGGTFTERAYKFLEEPGRLQLQKPFRHEQLLALVEKRLAELSRTAQLSLH